MSRSVVLLSGAGLLIRSYLAVQGTDKGFDESTLTMGLAPDGTALPAAQMGALQGAVLERVAVLPCVTAAGSSNVLPLSHAESSTTFEVEGYANRRNQSVAWRRIAGDYFAAMKIPLVAGRYVTTRDIPAKGWPAAVVVSRSFAKAATSAMAVRKNGRRLSASWLTCGISTSSRRRPLRFTNLRGTPAISRSSHPCRRTRSCQRFATPSARSERPLLWRTQRR
jgi:hypothetical protein